MQLRPRTWLFRQRRQLRIGMVLCLTITYGTMLLASIPILTNLDKIATSSDNNYYHSAELHYSARMSGHRPVDDDYEQTVGKRSENNNFFLSKLLWFLFNPATKQTRNDEINGDGGRSMNEGEMFMTGSRWNIRSTPALFNVWKNGVTSACGDRLRLYVKEFARLTSVVIDRRHCVADAKGGEEIAEVLRQEERAEYYGQMRHCFQLDCDNGGSANQSIAYRFNNKNNYLNTWLDLMKKTDVRITTDGLTALEPGFTVALTRREYANLYHTVNEWYNLFLMMVFFGRRPDETNVLLVDAHPKGSLDDAWSVLFNSTRMLSALPPQTTVFADMVWAVQGYNSLLRSPYRPPKTKATMLPQSSSSPPPLLEEFRRFVLGRFRLKETKTLNCSNVSVLFIWRRDYLAHPRNPSGLVKRKIANEAELLTELRRRNPRYSISGVQIDRFSMRDQLRLVSEADVLVGMHGAGLSHTLFVPPHAGTVELVPSYYGASNEHFVNMGRWRGLVAERWINKDRKNELKGYSTVVPVPAIDALLAKTVAQVCSETPETRLERRRRERSAAMKAGWRWTKWGTAL